MVPLVRGLRMQDLGRTVYIFIGRRERWLRDCDLGRVVARRGWEWLGGRAWDVGSASGMETYIWSGGFEAGWILLMIPFILNNNLTAVSVVHTDE